MLCILDLVALFSPPNKITDYLIRVVQPQLLAIEGIQNAEILGKRQFALRAWLDPQKMTGFHITSADVANALASNNFISAAGRTDAEMITVNLIANTDLHSVEEFGNLILKSQNGAIIRLKDVAKVSLGAENYDTMVGFDGKQAVYIGLQLTPSANLLNVIDKVRKIFPSIQAQLPEGLNAKIVYDSSICRWTFSTTIMASSTTNPIASTKANKVNKLTE